MSNFLLRYKYLPFTEGSLKVLDENTLKFTHPDDFNDPFDCLPYIDEAKLAEFMLKQPDLKRLFRAQYGSGAKFLRNKTKTLKYLEKKKDSFLSATMKNVGVLCLSKNSKNILMWSHYAQNHTGFVLEFKINLIPKININQVNMNELVKMLYPYPVKYSDKRPSLDFDNINSSLQTGLLTKHTGWAYEEEERVIDLVHGPGIHKFNPMLVNSVILGMKMSPDNKKIISEKIKEFNYKHSANIDVFSIKAVADEFQLIIEQYR